MDADNSGTITVDELRRGLAKQGTKLSEAEVEQLMEAVSFSVTNLSISRIYNNTSCIPRWQSQTNAGRRGRERDDRLRGVHHRDDAHEPDGQGGAPLHRVPVLRQGRQRVTWQL